MILVTLILIGRLHPALVHLPIGILLLAFLLECLSYSKRFEKLKPAVGPSLLIGSVSAILSAVTGYILSLEGGYDAGLLVWHQYLGISTAIVSAGVYFILDKSSNRGVRFFSSFVLISLVLITGHLGGSLARGSNYLFGDETALLTTPQTMLNPDQAKVFESVVQPILSQKCYNCHSSKKQKGQLRLDTKESLEKGGKHGVVVKRDHPNESELIKRILLPVEDEHHMPPREHEQLTFQEAAVIQSWIEEGASFDAQLQDFKKPLIVKKFIDDYSLEGKNNDFPSVEISAADAKAIEELKQSDVHVMPVGASSNYLTVSFSEKKFVSGAELMLLKTISPNIVELDLRECEISSELLEVIGGMNELRKLFLERSSITDSGIDKITSLKNLSVINLSATVISDPGTLSLARLIALKKVYLFQSEITRNGFKALQRVLPMVKIDSGNYRLPVLASDTVVYRKAK